MSLPLVSIIVPVSNGEKYLRESLDSILAQTYSPCEILVMNDASTDSTLDIIATYGNRLRHHSQSQNKGQYQIVNEALSMVQGTYIAVYHADDVYEPSIVQKEVEFFENHPEVGAVFCQDIFIDAEGNEYGRLTIPAEIRHLPALTYPTIFNAVMTHKIVSFVRQAAWCGPLFIRMSALTAPASLKARLISKCGYASDANTQ